VSGRRLLDHPADSVEDAMAILSSTRTWPEGTLQVDQIIDV
jgi:hypothetical protein